MLIYHLITTQNKLPQQYHSFSSNMQKSHIYLQIKIEEVRIPKGDTYLTSSSKTSGLNCSRYSFGSLPVITPGK